MITQGKMIMQDKLEKERNDAKNAVEEYVYEFRDKLSGPYEKFVCEKVGYSFRSFPENTNNYSVFLSLTFCHRLLVMETGIHLNSFV